jgi:hypothetical protein
MYAVEQRIIRTQVKEASAQRSAYESAQRQRRDGETLSTRLLGAAGRTRSSDVKLQRCAFDTPSISIYPPSKASV